MSKKFIEGVVKDLDSDIVGRQIDFHLEGT
jgi:hypothetical protein